MFVALLAVRFVPIAGAGTTVTVTVFVDCVPAELVTVAVKFTTVAAPVPTAGVNDAVATPLVRITLLVALPSFVRIARPPVGEPVENVTFATTPVPAVIVVSGVVEPADDVMVKAVIVGAATTVTFAAGAVHAVPAAFVTVSVNVTVAVPPVSVGFRVPEVTAVPLETAPTP